MSTRVRVLGDDDLAAVTELLAANPTDNLFVLARVSAFGLRPESLGCTVFGAERDGELVSLVHAGSNVVPIGLDEDTVELFAREFSALRWASSIMGRADQVRPLWEALCRKERSKWAMVRELRPRQPLMAIEGPPAVEGDPRVREITLADVEPYFEAAVAMYTEEVGVNPIDASGSYRTYIRTLIMNRRAFGIVEDGKVLFKADVGSVFGPYCQIQGVWLAPELRGQGASIPAMASVVELVGRRHQHQSLYVNDFNTRARRLYRTVGFAEVGTFATVLY